MRERIVLDGREMRTKETFHAYVKEQLNLPSYYGNNLDALKDCLTTNFSPRLVEIAFAEEMKANLGKYGEIIVRVFQDAARENDCLEVQIKTERDKSRFDH